MTVTTSERESDVTEEAFRARARAFLREHATPASAAPGVAVSRPASERGTLAAAWAYQAALFDASLAALAWPKEYGGQGLPGSLQTIFYDVATGYVTPDSVYTIGFGMCIPTLLAHGSEADKRRFVYPAARGEEIWCQLFSEPSAGSDVASLRSRAVSEGERWVLDGQKVWTSGAQHSQWGIVLARTDPDQPKHRGLSMFVLDMGSPGVTVRPLRQMNGGSGFNEVFLDHVQIPGDLLGLRTRASAAAGRVPGPEGSAAKLAGALHGRRVAEVACRLAGPSTAAWAETNRTPGSPASWCSPPPRPASPGGTNEVMRTILGERMFGLAKEPAADREVPFRVLPLR